MAIDIAFQDFRGFHQQGFVPVRRLTLLVGENSAGKTTFLAGLKFVGDLISGTGAADFNAEPFQLGTFEQIAHNRGGRAGRAKKFSISIRRRVPAAQRPRYTTLMFQFSPQEIGASLSLVEMRTRNVRLQVKQLESGPVITLSESSSSREWDGDASFFSFFGGALEKAIGFALSNLSVVFREAVELQGKPWWDDVQEEVGGILDELRIPQGATSAIRTKPLRTYTPGTDEEDGEGSHVPYELAKLARRRDKSDWASLKEQLERFGAESEMFSEVDVKSFGKTLSDPFQIQLGLSGPKRNIVDLGYGTSQVLPILYNIIAGEGPKRFLIQQPEVHLHPRAQAALGQFFVEKIMQGQQQFILETHSDFILDRARLAVSNGDISPADISILFFSRGKLDNKIVNIPLSHIGDPVSPPEEYRKFFIDEQMLLLGV